MKVIITGGMGFIGSNVARYFVDHGHSVCIFDIRSRKLDYLDEARKSWKYYRGSITELESLERVVEKEKPTAIIHTAVAEDFAGVHNLFEVNVRGTACVLELARRHDLYVVAVSSGTVYGQLHDDKTPVKETQPLGPTFPLREYDSPWAPEYCVSKRMAEQWVQIYRDLYNLHVACPRLGWVYGPGPTASQLNTGFSIMLRKAIARQPFRAPFGEDTFCDLVYVKDVCDALMKSVKLRKSLTFNVSYDRGYLMNEVADSIMRMVHGSRIELGHGIWPSKGVAIPRGAISWPSNRHMDNSLAKAELGYTPVYDLDTGICELADWIKKNWRSCCSSEAVPAPS